MAENVCPDNAYVFIKQVVSCARCDWSVTVFISGYGNTVVTSQHVSQSYFIKEIENVHPGLCLYNLMQIGERGFGRTWKYLCNPSPAARVHINFQILPNSLSRVHIRQYKHGQWSGF